MQSEDDQPSVWPDLPSELDPIAMRLARVDECVFAIGDLASSWSARGPLDLEQRRKGTANRLVVAGIRPVPPLAWLLFSEGISHLRSAIDNTVWFLLEREHGPIPDKVATRVAMPIYSERAAYLKWCAARRRDGLVELDRDAELGSRIAYLQPCHQPEQIVRSNDKFLAALMREEVESAHPLSLLQAYSNADKHRAIRVAFSRSITSHDSEPFLQQSLQFRELKVGEVLSTGTWGDPLGFEATTGLMVQRPSPYKAMVAPARELGALFEYVRGVVIPVLLSGVALPRALPAQVDLGDNGATDRDRIRDAGRETATERLLAVTLQRYAEAISRPVEFPPVIEEDE